MKKFYTHENRLIVYNIKNVLQQQDIATVVVNEYAAGGAGDLATFDTWPELWLQDEADFERADSILQSLFKGEENDFWYCKGCQERNHANFQICWSCARSYE